MLVLSDFNLSHPSDPPISKVPSSIWLCDPWLSLKTFQEWKWSTTLISYHVHRKYKYVAHTYTWKYKLCWRYADDMLLVRPIHRLQKPVSSEHKIALNKSPKWDKTYQMTSSEWHWGPAVYYHLLRSMNGAEIFATADHTDRGPWNMDFLKRLTANLLQNEYIKTLWCKYFKITCYMYFL